MAKQSRIAHISDSDLANMTAKDIGAQFYNGNTGAGYNAAIARGIKPRSANVEQGAVTGERKVRPSGKRKGCFPAKLDASLNKALGCTDPDSADYINEPAWSDFVRAREIQGADWVAFISKKVKEKELEQFELWVASNDAADAAEDAAYQAQQKALDAAIALIEAAGGKVVW